MYNINSVIEVYYIVQRPFFQSHPKRVGMRIEVRFCALQKLLFK